MKRPILLVAALVALGGLALGACARGTGLEAAERTIYMAAIEPKGTTTVAKEPFPTAALPAGGGYALAEPNERGEWTVETYRWLPGEVTVVQGDRVTLEILGVNGESHPTRIEGYGLEFVVKRGQVTTVPFTADKAGIFRVVCTVHQPTMTGTLVVLPR